MLKKNLFMKISSFVTALSLSSSILLSSMTTLSFAEGTDTTKTVAKSIDIVSFNDFHGTLQSTLDSKGKDVGAVKLAGEINKLKAKNPNTIAVAAGDLYQGSAMSNLTYGEPVSKMLKAIGVEASAVGNHEFDWGLNYISKWATDGGFDFLASNIYDKKTDTPVTWAKPYKIVTKDGKKIGFIGLSTPETEYKTKPDIVKDIVFKDPIASANYWAKYLKETEKVDFVIALTHLGATQDAKTKEITGEGADLAKGAKNIDAIITGHTHTTVAGVVNNIPVVQGYYNGRTLAKLSINFDAEGKFISITPSLDELYKRTDLVEDATVKTIYSEYETKLKPILSEVIATTDSDLSHDKLAGLSVLGQLTSKIMAKAAGTQIGITNGGGLRTSIAKGNITMGNLYEVMPFDNTLVKMDLKGSDLKRVIENGIMNTSIGWVQFYGLKVYYNKDGAAGNRITAMYLLDGTKVDNDKYYSVVTNDFMATGGDQYNFTGAKNIVDTALPIRDALVSEFKAIKNISYKFENSLIAGVDPATIVTPTTSTTTTTPAPVLPKTGSAVDSEVLVFAGSMFMLLGIFFVLKNKKEA